MNNVNHVLSFYKYVYVKRWRNLIDAVIICLNISLQGCKWTFVADI